MLLEHQLLDDFFEIQIYLFIFLKNVCNLILAKKSNKMLFILNIIIFYHSEKFFLQIKYVCIKKQLFVFYVYKKITFNLIKIIDLILIFKILMNFRL